MKDIITHYDLLIDENNDSFYDPPVLQAYMNKWDGHVFIDSLMLEDTKSILEIGVGTGRLAVRIAPLCRKFVGIDISPKTIIRAKENLSQMKNINLICADFYEYDFNEKFDIIYSSLTFMHLKDKSKAIEKIVQLLNTNGRLVISLDKNQDKYIEYSNRKIEIFPDKPDMICNLIQKLNMGLYDKIETEFANIIIAVKL